MKTPFSAAIVTKAARASGLFMIATGLALVYSVATSSSSFAQKEREAVDGGPPPTCTVCHKNRQNLDLPCNSMAYERHLGHGDSAGPCPPSRAFGKEEQTTKAAPVTAVSVKAAPAAVAGRAAR